MRAAIDLDGTIADFTTASFENVYKLYGIRLTLEDAYKPKTDELVWEKMTDKQRAKYPDHRDLYSDICPVGFFRTLEPLPGAIEAVKKLYRAGIEIVFLTKVLNWDRTPIEKAEWLKEYFGDIKYDVFMIDRVSAKRAIHADVVIDDDCRALDGITLGTTICVKQPWNEGKRDKYDIVVEDMVEAAEKTLEIQKDIEAWQASWDGDDWKEESWEGQETE